MRVAHCKHTSSVQRARAPTLGTHVPCSHVARSQPQASILPPALLADPAAFHAPPPPAAAPSSAAGVLAGGAEQGAQPNSLHSALDAVRQLAVAAFPGGAALSPAFPFFHLHRCQPCQSGLWSYHNHCRTQLMSLSWASGAEASVRQASNAHSSFTLPPHILTLDPSTIRPTSHTGSEPVSLLRRQAAVILLRHALTNYHRSLDRSAVAAAALAVGEGAPSSSRSSGSGGGGGGLEGVGWQVAAKRPKKAGMGSSSLVEALHSPQQLVAAVLEAGSIPGSALGQQLQVVLPQVCVCMK